MASPLPQLGFSQFKDKARLLESHLQRRKAANVCPIRDGARPGKRRPGRKQWTSYKICPGRIGRTRAERHKLRV